MKLFGKDLSNDLAFIAEIGVNHEGSVDTAVNLLKAAADAGADAVKFQSYTPEHYVSRSDQERFDRVGRFQLDRAAHERLKEAAGKYGIHFFSTAVSDDWVPYLAEICDVLKIASGDINFEPVIRASAATGKPVILSVGLGDIDEIDRAVDWFAQEVGRENLANHLALMHCIVAYPTPIEEANVANVAFLQDRYGITVGYSNHVIGPDACYAAVAQGAPIIEVHFTDQKDGRSFRDHSLSFEPDDLKVLIETAGRIKKSIGVPGKTRHPSEVGNLPPMRKGIMASRDLAKGARLELGDLSFARPANGFSCTDTALVIGQTLKFDVKHGHPILPKDLA